MPNAIERQMMRDEKIDLILKKLEAIEKKLKVKKETKNERSLGEKVKEIIGISPDEEQTGTSD